MSQYTHIQRTNKQNNTVFAQRCHQWHHTHWLIQTLTEADWSWVCAAELLLQLSWLTFSASMSPIEHVWDTLGQHVHQTQPQPINTAQLPPALTQKLVFFWRSGTLLCPSSWINKAKSFLYIVYIKQLRHNLVDFLFHLNVEKKKLGGNTQVFDIVL